MTDMLTAKEMQDLLQVDRSTIYRMAEAGRLPALKVGKQWRFPRDRIEAWLNSQDNLLSTPPLPENSNHDDSLNQPGQLAAMLPLDCVQLIQDAFAELLNAMLVVTDLAGQPITRVSNPAAFYQLLAETGQGHALCQEKWQELSQMPALEPRFSAGLAGLLCARAFVHVAHELKGMVIVFGVPPRDWLPTPDTTTPLAQALTVDPVRLQAAFEMVPSLSPAEQKQALVTIQRIADILAHISTERLAMASWVAEHGDALTNLTL